MNISYIIFGIIFLFIIGISIYSGTDSYFDTYSNSDTYSNQDVNKTSHRVEIDESIFVGADGHDIWLENNPDAGNTTLDDLIVFLKEDKTNEIVYNDDLFTCGDFAETVHNNAEAQGIRTGWVIIDFYNEVDGHAINVFDTDRGLIFYDGTNDDLGVCNMESFVSVRIGQQLIPVNGELLYDETSYTVDDYICDYYFVSIEGQVLNYNIVW